MMAAASVHEAILAIRCDLASFRSKLTSRPRPGSLAPVTALHHHECSTNAASVKHYCWRNYSLWEHDKCCALKRTVDYKNRNLSPSITRQVSRPVAYAPVSILIRLGLTSGCMTGVCPWMMNFS